MEGRLLGGLAGQDGVGPVLDQEGGSEGAPLRMARWRRPLPGIGGKRGGRVHTGLWRGWERYVNTLRAMTLCKI